MLKQCLLKTAYFNFGWTVTLIIPTGPREQHLLPVQENRFWFVRDVV